MHSTEQEGQQAVPRPSKPPCVAVYSIADDTSIQYHDLYIIIWLRALKLGQIVATVATRTVYTSSVFNILTIRMPTTYLARHTG